MVSHVRISGVGTYLPARSLLSSTLDDRFGYPAGTIESRTGVRCRHIVSPEETASKMGAKAAAIALGRAGIVAGDLDFIVCASAIFEQPIPCTAALIQRELGISDSGIPCTDVNATCVSFLSALDLVSYKLAAGALRRVLIVSTEVASAGLNWNEVETASLFGDGAAAAVVEFDPSAASSILSSRFETYSEGIDACQIKYGGTLRTGHHYSPELDAEYRFFMDGPAVFKMVLRKLPPFTQKLLDEAGFSMGDLKVFIPHQASGAAMHIMRRKLKVREDQWVDILPTHGNCIAASIPMALDEAVSTGRLQRGDLMCILGTGAGLGMAGMIVRY